MPTAAERELKEILEEVSRMCLKLDRLCQILLYIISHAPYSPGLSDITERYFSDEDLDTLRKLSKVS